MIILENFLSRPVVLVTTILVGLYLFWCLYIAVMGCYRAHLNGRLTGITKILAYPLVVVGILFDVFFQYTLFNLIFMDLPKFGEHLVTSRLKRYIAGKDGWRKERAKYICNNLLDMFDPTGEHC